MRLFTKKGSEAQSENLFSSLAIWQVRKVYLMTRIANKIKIYVFLLLRIKKINPFPFWAGDPRNLNETSNTITHLLTFHNKTQKHVRSCPKQPKQDKFHLFWETKICTECKKHHQYKGVLPHLPPMRGVTFPLNSLKGRKPLSPSSEKPWVSNTPSTLHWLFFY